MSDHALIVDDDETIRKVLAKVLVSNGLEYSTAETGEKALELIINHSESFQIILLDVMLGSFDGFNILKQIRSKGIMTPVIIVSAKSEDYDELYGLGLGADDYVSKPFNPVVLGAKVKALIRRANIANQQDQASHICAGPFKIDLQTSRFYKDGVEIFLSGKEMALMQLFIFHPGQVFSKEDLYQKVWGNAAVDDNAIMVYVNRLRAKIEDNAKNPKYLTTTWGVGYTFSV